MHRWNNFSSIKFQVGALFWDVYAVPSHRSSRFRTEIELLNSWNALDHSGGVRGESRPSVSNSACVLESGGREAPRRRRRTSRRAAPTASHGVPDSRNHATTLTHVPVSTVRARRWRKGIRARVHREKNERRAHRRRSVSSGARSRGVERGVHEPRRRGNDRKCWPGQTGDRREVESEKPRAIDASAVALRCLSVATPHRATVHHALGQIER